MGRLLHPFWWGAGPHLTQCRLGRGLPPCQVASSSIQPFDYNRWAEKWGCCALSLLFMGELGPHLTQYGRGRGLPSCQISSWSIQAFGHNTPTLQTDRQTRQTGQRSDGVGELFHKRSPKKPHNKTSGHLLNVSYRIVARSSFDDNVYRTLSTSGSIDNVMFSHNGPSYGVWLWECRRRRKL